MKKSLLLFAILGVILCTSCSNKEIQLTTDEIVLHHGETFQIEATSHSAITYTSANEYNAVVNENGLITANCVGETTITLNNGKEEKSVKVTVAPLCTAYSIPEFTIGQSKESVIAAYGTPVMDEEGTIAYTSVGGCLMVTFSFDENDNLQIVSLANMSNAAEDMKTFISERFMYYKDYADEDVTGTFYMDAMTIDNANLMYLYTTVAPLCMIEIGSKDVMDQESFVAKRASAKLASLARK